MWHHILLDVQGAVLALVVRQLNTNLSVLAGAPHERGGAEEVRGLRLGMGYRVWGVAQPPSAWCAARLRRSPGQHFPAYV